MCVLPQVALRRVLQVIDRNMTDAEASELINCSPKENTTNWWVTMDTDLDVDLKQCLGEEEGLIIS
jgi:hypothetical protein